MCLLCALVLYFSVAAQAQSGPVFVQHPPVTVNCGEPVPALPACEASSADCPGPVTITTLESETGALENHCTVSPSKLGNSVAWAFWLSLENMPVERWKFDGPAYFEKYADGTAHLWGTIVNYQNSTYKFEVSLWFSNRRNWEEWSALGRGYRNESGLAGSNYINWDYYELMGQFSTFTGIAGLAGDHLDVTPFPTSMYYGFQSGIGANNKNAKAGFGGAFGYSGMVKGEHCGAGVGHLSVDTNCDDGNAGCAATTYTRICKAVDTCGNVAYHTHSVSVVDNVAPELLPYEAVIEVECGQHYNNFISATDNCSVVVITYNDQQITSGCNGEILRTYTIADACGNSITATQTIHLFGDAEPVFTVFPEDTELSCSNLAEMNAADIQWEGPCLIYNLTYTDAQVAGNCPGNYTIVRTYTLTDDCGNQITQDWTVAVYDNEAPVLQGIPTSVTINCGEYIEEVNVTAQDNCDASFLQVNMVATTEYLDCGYNFIRTWTAVDGCGNVAEGSQTITLIDQQPPFFTYVPADVNLACANGVEYDENDMAIANDDCVGVIVLFEDYPLEGNCGTGFTRVFTAIDLCGNTATATQTISFIDTTAPVFAEYPTLIEVGCNEEVSLTEPVVTDECSSVSLSYVDEATPGCTGGFIRTYTATDGCGNASSLQVEVRHLDTTPPVVTSLPIDMTIQCHEVLSNDAPGLEYYDTCSEVIVTFEEVVSPTDVCLNAYNITRTYTLTDACGNSTEVQWNIEVIDTTAPQLLGVPQHITLNCGDALPEYNITATDNCDGAVFINQYDQLMTMDCGYQLHRTWVATDMCNNSTSAVQIVTYEDHSAPTFSFIPQDTSIVCDGTFDLSSLPVPTVSDDCGEAQLSINYSTETVGCNDPITINYIATDNCGNFVFHRQFITLVDQIAPVFTFVPEDATINCGDEFELTMAQATDNCSNVTITFQDAPLATCGGGYTRTYTATDACGNATTATTTVSIIDNEAPVITSAPVDVTVDCNNIPTAEESGLEYYDQCGTVTVDYNESTVDTDLCPSSYTLIREYTLTDDCGNSTVVTWTINVQDETAPVLSGVPANITLNCGDEVDEVNVTAQDNCDGPVLVNLSATTEFNDCGYDFIRTWTAVDACGNVASASQTVTLMDQVPPVFTFVPENVEISCSSGTGLDDLELATATDDCLGVVVTYDDSANSADCGDGITRTFTATDACGNTVTATQVITFVDNEAPVFTFVPEDITVFCGEDYELGNAVATDNCSSVTISVIDIFDTSCGGGFQRVFTATDACGNSTDAIVTVDIIDTTAPEVAVLPTDITVSCDNIPAYNAYIPQYTEECTSVMFATSEQTIPSNVCPNNYIIQRKWILTDLCGNATTVIWNITVVDEVAPVLVGVPQDITLNCGDPIAEVNVTAQDNCSGLVNVAISATTELNDCGYDFIRTWTATDACGNTAQASQTITLMDQQAPVFTFIPEDVTIACGSGTSINDLDLAVATDDCADVVVTYEDEYLGSSCGDGILRTFTATDACGNAVTATQMITYADNEAPVFTFVPADITAGCGENITLENPVATDDCSTVTIQFEDEIFGTCGSFIRTYTAQDGCGNTTTAEVTVNLEDTIAPVIQVPATVSLSCGEELSIEPIVSDNCTSIENISIVVAESTETIECGYILTKTWTAIDGCGNSSSATTIATFTDETAPVFSFVPDNISVDCNSDVALEGPVALDDCSALEINTEIVQMNDCAGSFIRIFTATDACGNTATAQQVVTRTDNQGPVFANHLANVFIDCSQQAPAFEVSATDGCSNAITYSNTETMEELECGYKLIRTRTATDGCGNSSTISQVVNVEDYAPPVFSFLPQNLTLSCSATIPAVESPTAFDQCSGETEVVVTESTLNGNCPSNYTIYRVYRSSDNCGNEAIHIQTINVVDNEGPTFINFEYEIEVPCEQSNSSFAIVVDNCSGATFNYTDAVFGSPCNGGIVRTYVATDGCGNQTTMQQFITILDDTAPVFTSFPQNITVSCDQIPLISDAVVTYQDNCSAVDVQYTENIIPGSCPNNYTLNRTWTLYDDCFNTTSGTWTIQVADNTPPTILGGPMDSFIDCTDTPPTANVFAIDNCGQEVPVSLVAATVEDGCNQIFTRRWVAVDACNNTSQFVSNVIITDLYAPELSAYPQDMTIPCGSEIPAVPTITALDNCADDVDVIFTQVITGTSNCQIITREWCATDCVGNEECHTQVITMEAAPGIIPNTLNAWSINPTHAKVEVTSEYDNNWVLEIYDLNGRVVEPLYNGFIGGGEKRIFTFNPRMFEDGIYIVRYTNGKDVLTHKILIAE
jgi:Fe-S cluster assembly iron-binding protein IscA